MKPIKIKHNKCPLCFETMIQKRDWLTSYYCADCSLNYSKPYKVAGTDIGSSIWVELKEYSVRFAKDTVELWKFSEFEMLFSIPNHEFNFDPKEGKANLENLQKLIDMYMTFS